MDETYAERHSGHAPALSSFSDVGDTLLQGFVIGDIVAKHGHRGALHHCLVLRQSILQAREMLFKTFDYLLTIAHE